MPPRRIVGTRAHIVVSRDGVKVYGNRQTFKSVGNWMRWLSESNPKEHFEFHFVWHLLSKFAKKPNLTISVDPRLRRAAGCHATTCLKQFEITFMAVSPSELSARKRPWKGGTRTRATRRRGEAT